MAHQGAPDQTVAWLALLISVCLTLWQVARYLLDGALVRVSLQPGLLTDYRLVRLESWAHVNGLPPKERWGWPVEVAVVKIENWGRTAVTVSMPGLDFGREGFRLAWRRTVAPRPLPAPDASLNASCA